MSVALIIGCGDVGLRVAQRLISREQQVTGIVLSEHSASLCEECGIEALHTDLDDLDALDVIETTDTEIYYFAPPPSQGEHDTRIAHFLAVAKARPPKRLVYISTTGVYGDCNGEWIDETWPASPQTERANRRWNAEQQLGEWSSASGTDVIILRVGGIYGPDRLPIERIPKMTVICPEEAPYSNRIHADDLAEICIAAMDRGKPGEIYNATDGDPTTMTDYLYRVADRAGIERPPCASLDEAEEKLSPAMLSFVSEARRIDNSKMLKELGVELQYPTLEKGLDSCF